MLWLLVAILSYLFFSLASLGDKLLLKDKIKPKLYTFYVGIFSGLTILLAPFAKFSSASPSLFIWIILEAMAFLFGVYYMFRALENFDASKAVPVIGAVQPIFVLILSFFVWGDEVIAAKNIIAFLILLAGSIIISLEKKPQVTKTFLQLTMISALMFSLDYIFSKVIFLSIKDFLAGMVLMRIFIFLFALAFLFNQSFRREAFSKSIAFTKKTGALMFGAQTAGGLAVFLQSFAISLAPVAYLAVLNSLRGIQYVFLFLFTTFLSYFYPNVLREGISGKTIIQKIFSIILIVLGLAVLSL